MEIVRITSANVLEHYKLRLGFSACPFRIH